MLFLRSHRSSLIPLWIPAFAALVACGGSPAAPSARAQLSILAPADAVRIGAFVDMQLSVVFPDGRTTLITPVWRTDRPDIIAVKPLSASKQAEGGEGWEDAKTGTIDHMLFARVTGLAPGDARVIADSSLGSASRAIRVLAN